MEKTVPPRKRVRKHIKAAQIKEAAERAGLSPATVIQRLYRTAAPIDEASLEEALGPLRKKSVSQSGNTDKLDQEAFRFFLEFTRDHGGVPPSLTDIQVELELKSVTTARSTCHRLVAAGLLKPIPQGKYIISGSRWLDHEENKALALLIEHVRQANDPEVLSMIETLTKNKGSEG